MKLHGMGICAQAATFVAVGAVATALLGANAAGASTSKLAKVDKLVAQDSKRPDSIGITAPITKPIPKGKKIMFIQCSLPSCVVLGTYLSSATKALGWTLVRIDGGTSPQTIKAAYDQAISEDPDAVIGTGFPKEIFSSELATLASKHIPVIEMASGTKAGTGITASFGNTDQIYQLGQFEADWAMANSKLKAKVLIVTSAAFPSAATVNDGFNSEISKYCKTCVVSTLTVPATSVGATLPTRIVSALQKDSTVTYVDLGVSSMEIGVPAALKAAHLTKVQLLSAGGDQLQSQYTREGEFGAIAEFPWPELMWRAADTLARVFTNQSIKPDTTSRAPNWLVTAKNLPSQTVFPLDPNYQAQFKKLWH